MNWTGICRTKLVTAAFILSISTLLLNGCGGKSDADKAEAGLIVEAGDRVSVHYVGTLDDESVFDSSTTDNPLVFVVGEGRLIPGFENAVMGLGEGDETKTKIPAEEAYGKYNEEWTRSFDRGFFPEGFEGEVGQVIQLQDERGNPHPGKILEVTPDSIKLDMNHPLADQALTFDITVVKIEKAPKEGESPAEEQTQP